MFILFQNINNFPWCLRSDTIFHRISYGARNTVLERRVKVEIAITLSRKFAKKRPRFTKKVSGALDHFAKGSQVQDYA